MGFTNTHLSYSRLSLFEQCPMAFKFRYIDKLRSEPGMPLRFGKIVHATLEELLREVIDQEAVGPLSEARAIELLSQAWAADQLTGSQEFAEAVAMVKEFVRSQGVVDHRDVLAVEQEFHLQAGPFAVLGFIDRVDRIDDETIEVVDYKTNRQLFTREEVDTSLQMSLYEIAARKLWPWARKVRLSFVMLRHGVRMSTTRTAEQLESAMVYVETLGKMTEAASEFPARLNGNCAYCDYRDQCPSYKTALKGQRTLIGACREDLEAVAREREEVARLAKILYARKLELEGVLRAHLKHTDELVLGNVRYSQIPMSSMSYPIEQTLDLLQSKTGLSRDELVKRVATVDKDALSSLLKEHGKSLDKSQSHILKAEFEAIAERTISPRFNAKEVRT
jgi:RecB family exonuclease